MPTLGMVFGVHLKQNYYYEAEIFNTLLPMGSTVVT